MGKGIITKWIGNMLIGVSLVGFVLTLYPLVQIYFFPKKIDTTLGKKGEYITIPKIQAQAKIIEDVDPWNEKVYKSALTKGVAHARRTAHPGERGTMFLFAHSSGLPWELTNNNAPFLRVGDLIIGDQIEISKNGRRYIYIVNNKKEIWPTEIEYLNNKNKNELILQTCTPIGTSFKRLLIFAQLQAA